ncbi:MAG: prepilin-type N-terminal cleavage/methylation domain-containing protein [Phycisphaerae bacterium]|nr:prepilin-type N-terminal cleavage/methylation domain-containing protein [Phycisphaerae bacterium]
MKTEKFRAFTPTPICVVGEQVNNMQKQVHRQISNFLASYKLVRGFTLPELLTAIAIIAILIGVLMPALSQVKRIAKETKQKAQIGSIEMAIMIYKQDTGAYPPSEGYNLGISNNYSYCGAQTLAEAMFGQDLLGFHVESGYVNEGKDNTVPDTSKLYIYTGIQDANRDVSLSKRKGPYLDRTNISVFTLGQIFNKDTYTSNFIVSDRYVICDVFTAVNRSSGVKNYKIGTPILYFRANPSAVNTELIPSTNVNDHPKNIYNYMDNYRLMALKSVADGKDHPLWSSTIDSGKFCGFIGDPQISNLTRPVRPDSFLLISAGNDGLYGTKDDICNFDPNLP